MNGVEFDDRTADKVQMYLDDCRHYDGPSEFAWTEVRFDLAEFGAPAPMFGTADRVEYLPAEQRLCVRDYKNGHGWVDARTPQGRYYALGAIARLGADRPVSTVEVTICQPEHGEPRRCVYDAVELVEWSVDLMDHARATLAPDAPRHAGPWCRYCPAAGACAEQTAHNLALAQQEFGAAPAPLPSPDTLAPEALAEIIARASEFEAWLDSVRAYAIQIGGVPGYKVVEGAGRSAWRDPIEAGAVIEAMGNIDPWVLASVPQIRARLTARDHKAAFDAWDAAGRPKGRKPTKKAAEEAAKAVLRPLTFRPSTGKVLVRDTDRRPAIPNAAAEFGALPEPTATL